METIAVSSGKIVFDFPDTQKSFKVGLTAAIIATGEIMKKREAVNGTGFGYLDDFQKWITDQGGPEFDINELDALWDMLQVEYDRQKKTRQLKPTSPSSTELTPSD